VDELKLPGRPFEISKRAVWEAWEKVRANKGAPGVDGESVADFEKDLKGNLYKIWNRMSSGTYFSPPGRAVEVAKAHGMGTRILSEAQHHIATGRAGRACGQPVCGEHPAELAVHLGDPQPRSLRWRLVPGERGPGGHASGVTGT